MRGELAEGGEGPFRENTGWWFLPGASIVTTAQRSGRSRRTGRMHMNLAFYLSISACRSAPQSAACVAVPAHAGTAGGFPPDFPIRLCRTGDPTPPFQIQQACLSLLTKAPLYDAPLSTRDACPQQAGLADGVVIHLEVCRRQHLHGMMNVTLENCARECHRIRVTRARSRLWASVWYGRSSLDQ